MIFTNKLTFRILTYLRERYSEHTAKCYLNYFHKYSTIFFSPNPHVELLKLAAHKRSWILQAIKRFGDYYYRKYNNREVVQLIREIIERYDLNRDLPWRTNPIVKLCPQIHSSAKKINKVSDPVCQARRVGEIARKIPFRY
jgi:hypothetical protein